MFSLIIFTFTVAAALAGAPQEVAVTQDTLGNYKLRYAIEGISRVEHGDLHGNVNGGFAYIDPHGILRKTEFTSGVHGYHAIGTDIPVPVVDTPEVAHAKANHLAILRASYLTPKIAEFQGPLESLVPQIPLTKSLVLPAAPLAPLAPVTRLDHSVAILPTLGHIGIAETPEVLAARAQHFAAHAAAKSHLLH